MKKLVLASILALVVPAPARPQVAFQMQVNVGLPPQPPLVVVQPGIQVVENWNEEVFVTSGYYWVHRDDRWYRAPGPHATFVYVEPRHVPPGLTRLPPGHYKHYRKEQAKAEERARKEHEKAERKASKEREKEAKQHGKQNGHGHD
jgi:hypothetical protein